MPGRVAACQRSSRQENMCPRDSSTGSRGRGRPGPDVAVQVTSLRVRLLYYQVPDRDLRLGLGQGRLPTPSPSVTGLSLALQEIKLEVRSVRKHNSGVAAPAGAGPTYPAASPARAQPTAGPPKLLSPGPSRPPDQAAALALCSAQPRPGHGRVMAGTRPGHVLGLRAGVGGLTGRLAEGEVTAEAGGGG